MNCWRMNRRGMGKGMEWKYGGYIRGMTRLGARERERHRCYYEMRGEPKAARERERARVRGIWTQRTGKQTARTPWHVIDSRWTWGDVSFRFISFRCRFVLCWGNSYFHPVVFEQDDCMLVAVALCFSQWRSVLHSVSISHAFPTIWWW